MAQRVNVVTGATGLLGSHIAEQLVARGEQVRALVRPTSDTTFLKSLGVELVTADLGDAESLRRGVDGADVVYHSAARVGEWGPWRLFREEVVESTGRLLDACRDAAVGRVLHVSSVTVYGHPKRREGLFTEDEPLGQRPVAVGLLLPGQDRRRGVVSPLPAAVDSRPAELDVRPARPDHAAARVACAGSAGAWWWSAAVTICSTSSTPPMSPTARSGPPNTPPRSNGSYNLSSEGEVTQRGFIHTLCEALGHRRSSAACRFSWLIRLACLRRPFSGWSDSRRPPHLTRYAVSLLARPTRFSIERARSELGWRPTVSVDEGFRSTLEWYAGVVGRPVKELLNGL